MTTMVKLAINDWFFTFFVEDRTIQQISNRTRKKDLWEKNFRQVC